MHEFVMGIATSMTASLIAVLLSWSSTRAGRRWLMRRLSNLSGSGLHDAHRQQRLAGETLRADLGRARWVKVMTGRGNEITRETFQSVWQNAGSRIESVQVLLPQPDATWLGRRASEVTRHDPGFAEDLLRIQVIGNIRYVAAHAARADQVELRLFDLPHTARVVITDRVAYLTPYAAHEHGRSSPCLVYGNPSAMYEYCLRLFSVAWDSATAAPPALTQRDTRSGIGAGGP
ncbi:hypothetical protein AB0H83_49780 [Dactylosporangium sp. NPDC050688]|uniref:hypothetical protein n=1 Tax=Dactylosporangium sp. NPDC050688 TaxID=3157217 RepID=UPI0033C01AFE